MHGNGIHVSILPYTFKKKTICNLTGKHCDIKRTNDMDKVTKESRITVQRSNNVVLQHAI